METNTFFNTAQQSTYQRIYEKFSTLFYIIYFIFFAFNFLGLNEIKYIYGVFLFLFGLMAIFLKPSDVFPYFFPFAMIEGQGRVLWHYHPSARLVFDLFLLLVAFRAFYQNKKIINLKILPSYIYILIIFHFGWYIVQLLNPNSLSIYAVLTASKIYIVPFILFFSFLISKDLASEKNIKKIQHLLLFTLFLSSTLAIFQFYQGDSFIISLNSYYKNILKDAFTGSLYRPFSTTHLPGGYASYMALFLPLLFIRINRKGFFIILQIVILLLSLYAMFLAQVRSSLLKGLLCVLLINLGLFIKSEKRIKKIFISLCILGISTLLINQLNISQYFDISKYNIAIQRLLSLTNIQEIQDSREGPSKALNYILHNIKENPMGLGPGRTGGVSNLHMNKIGNDPVYGYNYSWAWDNLFISLVIDFGLGMIFYLLVIFIVPIKLLSHTIRTYYNNTNKFTILLVTSITTSVILLGNWAGILLPYNPESFCFWYYGALGFRYINE